jgi:hypothetical protein
MMRYRQFYLIAMSIFLAFLLSSCSAAPTKKFIRTEPAYPPIQWIDSIGVLADVCLARDVLAGPDYISVEDSRLTEQYILDGTTAYLEQKGYRIGTTLSPFVGAFKTPKMEFKVALRQGSDVLTQTPPFFVSDTLRNDEEFIQALGLITDRTLKAVGQSQYSPSEIFLRDELLDRSLKTTIQRTHLRYLLVVIGNGQNVSGAKSFLQRAASGLVTGIGSLALSSGSVMGVATIGNVSYIDSFVGLIDLETGKILWSNSLRLTKGKLAKRDYYLKKWAPGLLYHFPKKSSEG